MLSFFFHDALLTKDEKILLDEGTVRHVIQVLRMQAGESLLLTDGRGAEATAVIAEIGKKSCAVRIEKVKQHAPRLPALHLCMAFTKNAGRNEWLLEKAVELGVVRVTPLITARSEKIHAKPERWRGILISAMLQSQQAFLPQLDEPEEVESALKKNSRRSRIYLAHCLADRARRPLATVLEKGQNATLLIGPEGDFTPEEISLAEGQGATGITLGSTRLRTETAALAALSFFHLLNDETV